MLEQIKQGEIDLMIIYKLDRLSRSVIDVYSIIELLNQYKCNLIAVMDELNIGSANGRMLVGMLAIIAQWERESISERTNEGMVEMAKKGLFPRGGKPPYGYDRSLENQLVINQKEAQIIKLVFKMVKDGKNISEINRRITKKGKVFKNDDSIKQSIRNKIYYGEFYFKEEMYSKIAPPIIDKKLYKDANKELEKRLCCVDNEKYYFSQIIKCQAGHKLLNKSTKKKTCRYYYYVCETCKNERINQNTIVEEVLTQLIAYSFDKDYSKREKKILKQIKNINKRIEDVYCDYTEATLDAKLYAFTLSKLENNKSALYKEIRSFKISNFIAWNEMSDRERKYFVQNNIDEIIIDIGLKKVLKIVFK